MATAYHTQWSRRSTPRTYISHQKALALLGASWLLRKVRRGVLMPFRCDGKWQLVGFDGHLGYYVEDDHSPYGL